RVDSLSEGGLTWTALRPAASIQFRFDLPFREPASALLYCSDGLSECASTHPGHRLTLFSAYGRTHKPSSPLRGGDNGLQADRTTAFKYHGCNTGLGWIRFPWGALASTRRRLPNVDYGMRLHNLVRHAQHSVPDSERPGVRSDVGRLYRHLGFVRRI